MTKTIHREAPDPQGRVYCRHLDMRVAITPQHFAEWCLGCPYFAGSNQGEGVECEYDEDHDPYAVPWRELAEADARLAKALRPSQQAGYALLPSKSDPLHRRWQRLYPEGTELHPTLRRFEATLRREQRVTDPHRLLPGGEWTLGADEARELAVEALAAALEPRLGRRRARYVAENAGLAPHDLPAPHVVVGKGVDPAAVRTVEALLRCVPYDSGLREVHLEAHDRPRWAGVYLPTTQSIHLGAKGERKGTLAEVLLHEIGHAVFQGSVWNGQRRLWQHLLEEVIPSDERAHEVLSRVHDPHPDPENYRYASEAFAHAWELYWQGHHLGERVGTQLERFAREAREFHPGRVYDPERPLALFSEGLRLSDFLDPRELAWNRLPAKKTLPVSFLSYLRSAVVRERWGEGASGGQVNSLKEHYRRHSNLAPDPLREAMNAALESLRTIGVSIEGPVARLANGWQGDVMSEYVYAETPVINTTALAAAVEALPESAAKKVLPRIYLSQILSDKPTAFTPARALALVVEWDLPRLRVLSGDEAVAHPVRMVYALGVYEGKATLPTLREHPRVASFYAVEPEKDAKLRERLLRQGLHRTESEVVWNYGYHQDPTGGGGSGGPGREAAEGGGRGGGEGQGAPPERG